MTGGGGDAIGANLGYPRQLGVHDLGRKALPLATSWRIDDVPLDVGCAVDAVEQADGSLDGGLQAVKQEALHPPQ